MLQKHSPVPVANGLSSEFLFPAAVVSPSSAVTALVEPLPIVATPPKAVSPPDAKRSKTSPATKLTKSGSGSKALQETTPKV